MNYSIIFTEISFSPETSSWFDVNIAVSGDYKPAIKPDSIGADNDTNGHTASSSNCYSLFLHYLYNYYLT